MLHSVTTQETLTVKT